MKKILYMSLLILCFIFITGFNYKSEELDYSSISVDELVAYVGDDMFVKDSSSILLTKTISSMILDNFVIVKNEEINNYDSSLIVKDDGYIGNGSTKGTYTITYNFIVNLYDENNYVYVKTFTKDIYVKVVDFLGCNYIFEDIYYTYKTNIITEDIMTIILKYLKVIPDVELFIIYESVYFEEINVNEDKEIKYSFEEYLVNYSYQASSGESGEGDFTIKLIDSKYQLNIDQEKDSNNILIILLITLIVTGIIYICYKFFIDKRKYKKNTWRF